EVARRILTAYPETQEAAFAVSVLWRSCSHGFNVPARSARAIQDLETYGEGLQGPKAAAFKKRIDGLKSLRAQWIQKMEELKEGPLGKSDHHRAALGDAE